jgi:hypothetical protein
MMAVESNIDRHNATAQTLLLGRENHRYPRKKLKRAPPALDKRHSA